MDNLIKRRPTTQVMVGNIGIGSNYPIRLQSMTNTDTADVNATVDQIKELADSGSELVRVTVNTEAATQSVPEIISKLVQSGYDVPIIGDFHFNGHRLLGKFPECAAALSKLRINPGNVGRGQKRDEQFASIVSLAIQYKKPIRIGVNWGSLDQSLLEKLFDQNNQQPIPLSTQSLMREAMILSALESVEFAKTLGMEENQLILSVKVSQCQDLIAVYRDIANRTNLPLHLGLTEAGMGSKGIIASTAALSILLQEGIGDTIRVSLTPEPGHPRTEEVLVAKDILQSLGIRIFSPKVTACPGCGRTSSDYFQKLALEIQTYLDNEMPAWKEKYKGVENMVVAVMGCVVNGPGESKLANIGISLPGSGEAPVAPVYEDGVKTVTLKGDYIATEFQKLVTNYVERTYGR